MSLEAIELIEGGVFLHRGREIIPAEKAGGHKAFSRKADFNLEGEIRAARRGTITHGILAAHNGGDAEPGEALRLRFDALASHDITYVGIIQTAAVSGLKTFPVPYILTNCHNSLCAVGGTINEDDHLFGLSAARKYGGIYVPPHLGVIHSYMREAWAGGGRMILGSDSHTRYGALGTLAVGEGGGELVKQLLSQTYDTAYPRVIAVYLEGTPRSGAGPMDAALALVGAVFGNGFAKNAALEFVGPGVAGLPVEYRNGIDVMTTETASWSSVWETDGAVRDYLALHGRPEAYRELGPAEWAYYDGLVKIKLDNIRPMIALPFHPSNVYELDELTGGSGGKSSAAGKSNAADIFRRVEKDAVERFGWTEGQTLGLLEKIDSRGRIHVDQGIIAGCAGGTFDNIMAVSDMLNGGSGDPVAGSGPAFSGDPAAGSGPAFSGDPAAGSGPENEDPAASGFSLSVYPGSQPVYLELARNGALARLAAAGVVIKTAFCGPCFGAGDVPAHRSLSIRHTTRNFPNREGSRPKDGQIASAALMDARSIAATARNGGILASAEEYTETGIAASTGAGAAGGLYRGYPYRFDDAPYRARVYNGFGGAGTGELRYGPNITGWPDMEALGENLLIKIVSFITDPVTTTDELIPSGETSSYRSNPLALAEFTLSRKDPAYVGKAKALRTATAALRTASAALRTAPAAPRGGGGGAEKPETAGTAAEPREAAAELGAVLSVLGETAGAVQIVSAIFAVKPGDGSAREQAASCQRVLGGGANFANEYATKRYRSNLVNWGMIPFIIEGKPPFQNGDYVYVPGAGALVRGERRSVEARIVRPRRDDPAPPGGAAKPDGPANGAAEIAGTFTLAAPELNDTERELLLAGSLINYNRNYNRARLESAGTGAPGGTA